MDKSSRQEINKDTAAFNDILDQMDLIDIFRAFHPKVAEYKFFSNSHETFVRIDHMLKHKRSLNKFKKMEIISSIFSDHDGMKPEINHMEKKWKTQRHGG